MASKNHNQILEFVTILRKKQLIAQKYHNSKLHVRPLHSAAPADTPEDEHRLHDVVPNWPVNVPTGHNRLCKRNYQKERRSEGKDGTNELTEMCGRENE